MNDVEKNTGPSMIGYGVPAVRPRGARALRVTGGVVLLLMVLPAAFGFLAAGEAGPNALVWRCGYMALGMACLTLGSFLIVKK